VSSISSGCLSVLCMFWTLCIHNFPSTSTGGYYPKVRTIIVNRLRLQTLLISLNGFQHLKCQFSHLRHTFKVINDNPTPIQTVSLIGWTYCTMTSQQTAGTQLIFHSPPSQTTGLPNLLLESAVILPMVMPMHNRWICGRQHVDLNPLEGIGGNHLNWMAILTIGTVCSGTAMDISQKGYPM